MEGVEKGVERNKLEKIVENICTEGEHIDDLDTKKLFSSPRSGDSTKP